MRQIEWRLNSFNRLFKRHCFRCKMPDKSSKTGLGAITISGLTELQSRLSVFAEKVQNQIVREAVRDGIKVFQKEAIQLAPTSEVTTNKIHKLKVRGVYIPIKPGNLKKNIKVKVARGTPKGTIRFEVYVKKKEAWYAAFVERGRSNMEAQPFMAPAFEAKVEEVKETFKSRVLRAIREGGI